MDNKNKPAQPEKNKSPRPALGRPWTLVLLASLYALSSVWALVQRIITSLMQRYGAYGDAAQFSTLSGAAVSLIFWLAPAVILFIAAESADGRHKRALWLIGTARAAVFITTPLGWLFGTASSIFMVNVVFSAAGAFMECAGFIIIAAANRKYTELSICGWLAAVSSFVSILAQTAKTYSGFRITGSGSLAMWVKVLGYTGTVQLFSSIVAGIIGALVYMLLRLEIKEKRKIE